MRIWYNWPTYLLYNGEITGCKLLAASNFISIGYKLEKYNHKLFISKLCEKGWIKTGG